MRDNFGLYRVDVDNWVCLKMGYTPNYSHLVGIMISKTIGCTGVPYFQTKPIGYPDTYFCLCQTSGLGHKNLTLPEHSMATNLCCCQTLGSGHFTFT